MVESNASLPQLRDYVNFSSDRELMSLIGQGKLLSFIFLRANPMVLLLVNRDFSVCCNDQKDQQLGVVIRAYVCHHQSSCLQHPQEKAEAQDQYVRGGRTDQDCGPKQVHNRVHNPRAFHLWL